MTGFTLSYPSEQEAKDAAYAYFDHHAATMSGVSLTITFGANAVIVSFWTLEPKMYRNDRFEF